MSRTKSGQTTPPIPTLNDDMMTSLAHMVHAMIPLAQRIVSDEFSPEERAKMRELAGGDGVFHLSNLLNSLCGETARELNKKRAPSGRGGAL